MIIEYLRQDFDGVNDERPFFVVDTAAKDVGLSLPLTNGYLRNGAGYKNFQPDDNYRIVSLGLFIPYQFTLSRKSICLGASVRDESGTLFGIIELTGIAGTGNNIIIPYDGSEFPLDITIAHKSTGKKEALILYPATGQVYVSMVNAPTALNGDTLHASFFAKVVHTLPMVA